MKAKRQSKAKHMSLDTNISMLPQSIIDTILCLLPIEEAARTSILSREWRYKWTKIPKLVFDRYTSLSSDEESQLNPELELELDFTGFMKKCLDMRCKRLFATMHQVLLLHQGPIHEFSLSTYMIGSCFELDQIILHLSRNLTVKKLSLELDGTTIYKLPVSVFSLHNLTDLYLTNVNLNHQPIFSGFGSLTTLYLKDVVISSKALLHLLSNSPSLRCLSLNIKQWDIGIIELLTCLPAIEHLTTWGHVFQGDVLDSVPQELPTSLVHLKCFCFEKMCFSHGRTFPFLAMLIKCSPNLEKIKLEVDDYEQRYGPCSVKLEEYSDVWLEHLNELEIEFFSDYKPEMEFVKCMLVRSPKLKKLRLNSVVTDENIEFRMLTNLLSAPRASPVEIIFERYFVHESKLKHPYIEISSEDAEMSSGAEEGSDRD